MAEIGVLPIAGFSECGTWVPLDIDIYAEVEVLALVGCTGLCSRVIFDTCHHSVEGTKVAVTKG